MRTRTAIIAGVGFTAAAVAFVACSDTVTPPAPDSLSPSLAKGGPPKTVKSVSVTPPSATVAIGSTTQLTATANPTGSATTIAWASSNPAVATVSSTGLVKGVATGTASITATAGEKTGTSLITVPAPPPPPPPPPPPGSEVLVGAGDIADCSSGAEATAKLLDGIAGTVFTLGDNAYPNGSASDYGNCYNPTWGRHKARTMPTPGNHEYQTANATGYFGYFGSAAGDPTKGYYSYNLGDWHIVVLNSNSNCGTIGCSATSPQVQWLRADLAANTKSCTLAYWHHPRFNSGLEHGNDLNVAPFWDALYEFNADVILNGHEHVYERFAPQTPSAVADGTRGIRQFTVGTGGASVYSFKPTPEPNSQIRNSGTMGVLKLTLRTGAYDWQFVPVAGKTFTDTGSGTCH